MIHTAIMWISKAVHHYDLHKVKEKNVKYLKSVLSF